MRTEEIDPAYPRGVGEAYAVYREAETYGRPRGDVISRDDFDVRLSMTGGAERWRCWTHGDEGRVVGVAMLNWSVLDNLHACWGSVSVAPAARRQGHGSSLLATLVAAAEAPGRRTLEIEVGYPIGEVSPGSRFLAARGFRHVMHETRDELRLPVVPEGLAGHDLPAGVEVVVWDDHCPDEWSAAFRRLLGAMVHEAPHGEREVEDQVWTNERLREAEAHRVRRRRTSLTAAAFAADGTCVAFTELYSRLGEPVAHQAGTLVDARWRGHRLGFAVKAANLRALGRVRPDVHTVSTYVSPTNAHMHRVNDALGFVPVETLDEWALTL